MISSSRPSRYEKKAVIFSPYSGIWKHKKAEILVAENLSRSGIVPEFIQCSGVYEAYCITMSAFGLTFETSDVDKKKICNRCKMSASVSEEGLGYRTSNLENYIGENVTNEIDFLLSHYDFENWSQITLDGFEIGKIAAYEMVIRHKISNFNLDPKILPEYRTMLRNCLLTYYAALDFFENNRVDFVFVYNRLYSANQIFCRVAEKYGIPTYSIEANGFINNMYSRYLVTSKDSQQFELNLSDEWKEYENRPLSKFEIRAVRKHILELFRGRSPWVYSSETTKNKYSLFRKVFQINENQKIVLVALSSSDEVFAASLAGARDHNSVYSTNNVFRSNQDWIAHLTQIARTRSDLFIIVRVHPREFPNKREKILSLTGEKIIENFRQLDAPSNIVLNVPSQNISIYDFLPIVDVICNSNSSTGLEFASFGIPVVVHDSQLLTAFPASIAFIAENREKYELTLDLALKEGISIDRAVLAYRWYYFRHAVASRKFGTPTSNLIIQIITFGLRLQTRWRVQTLQITRIAILMIRFINRVNKNLYPAKDTVLSTPSSGPKVMKRIVTQSNEEKNVAISVNNLYKKIGSKRRVSIK